jgi:hypothetical protein
MRRQPKRKTEKEQKIEYLLHDRITPKRGKIVWLQQGKEKIKKHSLLPQERGRQGVPILKIREKDLRLVLLLDGSHTNLDCFLIHGDELMMALGKRLLETSHHAIKFYHGNDLEKTAEDNHVESLVVTQLESLFGSVYRVDANIIARSLSMDTIGFVDKDTTLLYAGSKLIE